MEHQLLWCSKLSARIPTRSATDAVQITVVPVLALLLSLAAPAAYAESPNSLRYAKRLLQVSGTAEQFEMRTQDQIRAIIRTYLSIVNMSVDVQLPQHITRRISDCYQEAYAWENFEEGIAQIFSQKLSDKEMLLLIDFYRDLGLPPSAIDTFKSTLAKVPAIQEVSADYIFNQSAGCVAKDATAINDYLIALGSPLSPGSAP